MEELEAAKKTLIWDMLDAADWAAEVMRLTGATKNNNMDKAETNAYLMKRIGDLEQANRDNELETI